LTFLIDAPSFDALDPAFDLFLVFVRYEIIKAPSDRIRGGNQQVIGTVEYRRVHGEPIENKGGPKRFVGERIEGDDLCWGTMA
jgi:hypothetical protein